MKVNIGGVDFELRLVKSSMFKNVEVFELFATGRVLYKNLPNGCRHYVTLKKGKNYDATTKTIDVEYIIDVGNASFEGSDQEKIAKKENYIERDIVRAKEHDRPALCDILSNGVEALNIVKEIEKLFSISI